MKPLPVLVVLFLAASALSACNTARGIGRDVEAGGRAIGEAADAVEEEISD
jgi:predicted small secreted protein